MELLLDSSDALRECVEAMVVKVWETRASAVSCIKVQTLCLG